MTKTLNQLNEATTLADDDLLLARDTSAVEDKRITLANLKETAGINQRTIYVGSVAELEGLSLAEGVNVYLTEDGKSGMGLIKSGSPPSDPYKGIYIVLANGNYWVRQFGQSVIVGGGTIDARWFGAIGDWNGTTGTDNLQFFNAATDMLPAEGGTVGVSVGLDNNDFWISDTWNIRKSNTTLHVPRGVTIRCTNDTSAGQTVSFAEGAFYGGSDAAQLENVEISGGGTIRNTAPGTNENAIGFSRVKNYRCIGMNIPECNKKAITAQINCDEGTITFNNIGSAVQGGSLTDTAAISVEFGGTTGDSSDTLIGWNTIDDSLSRGIYITNVSGQNINRAKVLGNVVKSSTLQGFHFVGVSTIVESGNTSLSSGEQGFLFEGCSNVESTAAQSLVPAKEAMVFDGCGVTACISPMAVSAGVSSTNTYDAFVVKNATAKATITAPTFSGNSHRFTLSESSNAVKPEIVGTALSGASGVFFGNWAQNGAVVSWKNSTDGDTTPSVNGVSGIKFNNSSPTTVTAFDGGMDDQEILIFSGNSNTTIDHNVSSPGIRLSGAADALVPAGGFIRLVNLGSNIWYEISRSF